eukprot:gene32299-16867_t
MAAEDGLIRRIFAFCLRESDANASADPPVLFLENFTESLVMDAMGQDPDLTFNRDNVDGALVSRLIEEPPSSYPQSPLQYLLGCYARASVEIRSKAVLDSAELKTAVQTCKELIPPAEEARGSLQLLDSMDAQMKPIDGIVPLPPGFLEDFSAKYENEGLDNTIRPIVKELSRRVKQTSPLGDFSAPLSAITALVRIEPLARTLTGLKEWMPDLKDVSGRGIELPGSSWLGPLLCCSPIPDRLVNSQPNVVAQCFANFESRRQGDMVQSMTALRMSSKQIQTELYNIVKQLLGKGTREAMLSWLSGVLEGNMERGKMHGIREAMLSWLSGALEGNMERDKMHPKADKAASDGFFINFNAIMLKLCGPFMDPSNPNFWKRGETKLAMREAEETAWRERVTSSFTATSSASTEGPPPATTPDYHFICECFFITVKALHLGVAKLVSQYGETSRHLQQMLQQEAALDGELQS